jgi:hypothetical protein
MEKHEWSIQGGVKMILPPMARHIVSVVANYLPCLAHTPTGVDGYRLKVRIPCTYNY